MRDGTLSVATWNVHGCVGTDRRTDSDRVCAVIRELDADILGLQEVDARGGARAMEQLAEATGYGAVAGPTIEAPGRRYGNLLLTRHPVEAVRRIDLSVPGREPRGAIDASLRVRGRRIRVVVTHFGLRARERGVQAARLVEALGPAGGDTVLLLGDFNEWRPLARTLGPIRRRFGAPPAPASFPSRRPLLALDRIYVRPLARLAGVRVHDTRLARRASDHLPLSARVWPATG